MSIPVICDRCRATGISGEADFSHLGDLLEFTPVPRETKRVDGWSPEKQRAFIAALAATGSRRRAAHALGMSAYGVTNLRKCEGADSFNAAYDRAIAIAQANGSMRIASSVADIAARNAVLKPAPSALRGHVPEPEEAEPSEDAKWELLVSMANKFMRKVAAERTARLAGEIVAADFYLRQITALEVIFDLSGQHLGLNPSDVLHDLRREGHRLSEIASTEFTDWLDASRRRWWSEEEQPQRPAHPDVRFLEFHGSTHGAYATQVEQNATGACTTPARGYSQEEWRAMGHDQQVAARRQQFAEDAAEQRAWEAEAHRDYGERRASGASS